MNCEPDLEHIVILKAINSMSYNLRKICDWSTYAEMEQEITKLVTHSLEDYEALALKLAQEQDYLISVR